MVSLSVVKMRGVELMLEGTYVRREHCGGDFAAVFAVADVGVDEAVAFDGLFCVLVHLVHVRGFSQDMGILTTSS